MKLLTKLSCLSCTSRRIQLDDEEISKKQPYARIVEISEKHEIRLETSAVPPLPRRQPQELPTTTLANPIPVELPTNPFLDPPSESESDSDTEVPTLPARSRLHRRGLSPADAINTATQLGGLALAGGSLYVSKKTYDWMTREREREGDVEMGLTVDGSGDADGERVTRPVALHPSERRREERHVQREVVREGGPVGVLADGHGQREGWMGMR